MKTTLFKLVVIFTASCSLLAGGCKDRFPSGYALELPKLPDSWISLLGEPCWRIEWFDPGGRERNADILPGSPGMDMEIELPVTFTNPVTAWPYWPEHRLIPGFYRPAGALFPFDVKNNRLSLSWEAGVDAVFYRELNLALHSAGEIDYSRIPANFDWPRFRELFEPETLSKEVCDDPWLVNWRSVAERTIAGNFDRRRLVPEAADLKTILLAGPGPWYGASPFEKPLFFTEGEPLIFPVRPGLNVWISAEGILRINGDVWAFTARN
ncbi:MAG: hypothetical protein FWD40_05470 [Treponema sp.]|nr:hypothetical protein [Treponema sp.]